MNRLILATSVALTILAACSGTPATPSPTQVPTAAPTALPTAGATATAAAVYPEWYTGDQAGAGILAAGSHSTRSFVPHFAFAVPEGWVNGGDEPGFYLLFPDNSANEAEFAASGSLDNAMDMGIVSSPYFACDEWEDNSGATAAEMVAAMVINEALATSDPLDVTIGGLSGKQIDVQVDPAWTESCPGDPPGYDLGDTRARVTFLDVPDRGVLVIILGSAHSAGHAAFVAEAMPIIESFEFDVPE